MIFNWFNVKEVEKFAESMADYFAQRVPLSTVSDNNKKLVKKANDVTPILLTQVATFQKDHKLNTYKKARLARRFQSDLLSRGYDETVVQDLVNMLIRAM